LEEIFGHDEKLDTSKKQYPKFRNFLDMIKKRFWTRLKKRSSGVIIIYQIFPKPPPSRIPAYATVPLTRYILAIPLPFTR